MFYFIFIDISLYLDDELDYQHFLERALWKISMCCLFIMLIFYACFKREEDLFNIKNLIGLGLIVFVIFIILNITLINIELMEKLFYISLIAGDIGLDLFLFSIRVSNEKFILDWKINLIDLVRSGLAFLLLIKYLISYCKNNCCIKDCFNSDNCCHCRKCCNYKDCCGFCNKIINNYK